MLRPPIAFVVLLVAVLCVAGCSQSESVRALQVSDFPIPQSGTWVYTVSDSTMTIQDTVRITVVGYSSPTENEETSIWEIESTSGTGLGFLGAIDSVFVARSENAVMFQPKNECCPILNLQFPVVKGAGWRAVHPFAEDTLTAVAWDTVTVPAGTFTNVARLEETRSSNGQYLTREIWLTEGAGIVRISETPDGAIVPMTTWHLLSLDL